jgi:hypothetical protein
MMVGGSTSGALKAARLVKAASNWKMLEFIPLHHHDEVASSQTPWSRYWPFVVGNSAPDFGVIEALTTLVSLIAAA